MLLLWRSQISEELNIPAERVSYGMIFSLDIVIIAITAQHQQAIELNGDSLCRASVSVCPPAAQ